MAVLWLKFPDEIGLYNRFGESDKRKLEEFFSTNIPGSAWLQALEVLGLKNVCANNPLIYWHGDAPYFNWSCMVQVISGAAMHAVKTSDGKYSIKISYRHLLALMASQWKIAQFLERREVLANKFAESIALGIALQSLMMRLGSEADNLALWLSSTEQTPMKFRKTIAQMQDTQRRRTNISHIWTELFPPAEQELENTLPDFFWDDAIPVMQKEVVETTPVLADKWKGLAVCGGELSGFAIAITPNYKVEKLLELKQKHNAPIILVFRRARPETTELFQYADAVLYAEGGVLSHACTVVREMDIPCITALGTGFFSAMQAGDAWVKIKAVAGTVERLK